MIRFGILGFGLHAAKRLMPGFARAQKCTVKGIWRRDSEKAQINAAEYKSFQLQAFSTPEELCASKDIDAVFVASPDALHLPHTLLAISHGKAVLCEKPMAMNVAQCEQMIAAAEKAKVSLGVAHVFRFEASVNRLREIVAGSSLGRPLLARSEFHYLTTKSSRTWIEDPSLACGGPVGDVGVHCIDALRYILQDEVTSVFARGIEDAESKPLECAASLLLQFKNGTIGNVIVSTRGEYRTPLWIHAEHGMTGAEDALTVDHPIDIVTRISGSELRKAIVSNAHAYSAQVDAFARSLTDKEPFAAPAIEGLKNQKILDAAYRSIRSGNPEAIQ